MIYKFEKPIQGSIGLEEYQCTIKWRNGEFISDEPTSSGGKDLGPGSSHIITVCAGILHTRYAQNVY